RAAAEHPDNVVTVEAKDRDFPQTAESEILSTLFQANNKLTARFSQYRAEMSRDQHRVLIEIENNPGIALGDLAEKSYLGLQTAAAVVALFRRQHWIVGMPDSLRLTEAGQRRRAELAQRLHDMETDLLGGLPKSALDAAMLVLTKIVKS